MEMEEHSPSQAKPAKLPMARCEVRFHTSVHGWRMTQYGVNSHRTVVGCIKVYTCCTTGQIPW